MDSGDDRFLMIAPDGDQWVWKLDHRGEHGVVGDDVDGRCASRDAAVQEATRRFPDAKIIDADKPESLY